MSARNARRAKTRPYRVGLFVNYIARKMFPQFSSMPPMFIVKRRSRRKGES